MGDATLTLDEWSRLYQAAIRVAEIAPWKWMTETDIFGIQNPETDELGFISVMGELGEHVAIAVYIGPEGLSRFWDVQELQESAPIEDILGIYQLQVSFENRNELSTEDHAIIKKLGLRFRGQKNWPMMRSIHPGYLPWHIDAKEARFLTNALEQTACVAPLVKEDPALLGGFVQDTYLMRIPRQEEGMLVWGDRFQAIPPVEPEPILFAVDDDLIQHVKALPRSRHTFEIDFFMFPVVVNEKNARPFFPQMLLIVDAESEMIIASELLNPEPTLAAMKGLLPATLLQQFVAINSAPDQIKIRSPLLAQLLGTLNKELQLRIKHTQKLSALDRAKEELFAMAQKK